MKRLHGMRAETFVRLFTLAMFLAAATLTLGSPAFAQDDPAVADDEDVIVVTGSRIVRDEFSSAAPIQVFDTQDARQIGINSISEMLQRSTIAAGQQINTDLNTNAGNSNASEPSPLGGIGSANIGLRGLDPERTLILINGRRLGSSGIRGAPAQPDLNLIPFSLIQRVEVITEGASSVYGADAVAGVVNLITRDHFEGMEVSATVELPFDGGGELYKTSFIMGAVGDRARITFAGEFTENKRLSVGQRRDCVESRFRRADTGELAPVFCDLGFFDNVIFSGDDIQPIDPSTNEPLNSPWWFLTPGSSDTGIPSISSALAFPAPSAPGQECRATNQLCRVLGPIPSFSGQNDRLQGDLVQPQTSFSVVTLGAFSPDWWGSEELYFEAYYLNRHSFAKGGIEQIFPTVLGEIPELDEDGNVIVDIDGAPILTDNPLNPFTGDAVPIITLDELRQDRDSQLEHFRFVGGFRGDFQGDNDWSWDLFASYDRGTGIVEQPQMNENSLILSLHSLVKNADGSLSCGVPVVSDFFGFFTPQDCVPVSFFADSIGANGPDTTGTFATDEERAFLIGSRVNNTIIEQAMVAGYLTGTIYELPAGNLGAAIGGEWRRDTINSFADFVSAKGVNAGENPLAEGATRGSRDIYDLYAEVNVPLFSETPLAEYLGVEAAIRYTDDENFGSKITNRLRATWEPNDWITASGSYGTSFRSPNLRETFLAAQFQGFSSSGDPCGVPSTLSADQVYLPGLDPGDPLFTPETRDPTLLANCILSGADPTALGLIANVNIPVVISGNAQTLDPETSRSFTATLLMSPPISDNFDVDFAISFFDIELQNAIRSVDAAVIASRCFDGPANLASPFCDRIERTIGTNPNFDFITLVDASFVNIGQERSQGVDLNARVRTTVDDLFGHEVDIAWTGAMTFQTERTEVIFIDEASEDLLGDFGMPKRRFTSSLSFGFEPFTFIWEIRHLSGGETDDDLRAINSECDTPFTTTGRPAGEQFLAVCDAPGAWYNDISLTYDADTWFVTAGFNNLFDEKPPLTATPEAGSNRANLVTSSGYDQLGRTFFLTVGAAL